MTAPREALAAALGECITAIGMLRSFVLSGEQMSAGDEAYFDRVTSQAKAAALAASGWVLRREGEAAETERLRADLAVFTEEPGVLARVGAEHTTYWYNQTRLADANVARLREALEAIVKLLDPGFSPISRGNIHTAITIAAAALTREPRDG